MTEDKVEILKVLVGSRAHGLADANSDYDYRSVYVLPTQKILSLGFKYKGNDWIEGDIDNTSYEIGHFLDLAVKCNPSILEVMVAPVVSATDEGAELRKLFSYIWNPYDALNAFVGYSKNQQKKMLDNKDGRANKYAVAYLRVLYMLNDLLEKGIFSLEIPDGEFKEMLKRWRNGEYNLGEVINQAQAWSLLALGKLDGCNHVPDINKVNEFLLSVRRTYWT